jgi:hypothetical protein
MTTRYLPHDLKPWASDAVYPAGADPWSAQPNKVVPANALAATGYIPETRLPFPHLNWHQAKFSDAALVAIYQAMNTWRPVSPDLNVWQVGRFVGNVNGAEHVPDTDLLHTLTDAWSVRMGTPTNWTSGTALAGIAGAIGVVPSSNGEYGNRLVWASNSDRDIAYWPVSGAQQLVSNVVPATFAVGGLGMSHNGSKRLLAGVYGAGANTQRIYTSDDGGATWTARNTPANWSTIHVLNFTDNAAGTILATGNINGKLLRSTDNGDTWAEVSVSFSRGWADCYGIAYSPVHALFMCSGPSSAGVSVSADGSSWTNRSPSINFSDNTSMNSRFLLAASGPVFAHVYNRDVDNGADFDRRGIVWTADAGLTWRVASFGHPANNTQRITGIAPFNGGFVAWGGDPSGGVWTSMPMHLPDAPIVCT